MKLIDVIEELVEEKEIERSVLDFVICEGILAAYKKKYPNLMLQVETDKKTGEIKVLVEKEIVSSVEDEAEQISLKKARYLNKNFKENDKIWVPFEGKIGRIEILRARQVIASKIRQIEALAIYNEFKDKEGEIVLGIVHKCERGGMIIKIDDVLAFLPQSLSIPEDKCIVGFSIRALLKEVLPEPRNDNQLILDRVSTRFLQNLFELEIPEVFEKLVEIKKIVRAPGYKAKVVVVSNDRNIDPVGTCIGVGGSRIKPILKELGGEKIDVIPWSDSLETLIADALRPAKINRVVLSEDKRAAKVWLDEDQRSLAIGKMGQNISLASRLAGIDIQLETTVNTEKNQRDVDILEIEE
ncbi:MAG: transcription termination factor NusA [Candidatus Babeliales bacterium]